MMNNTKRRVSNDPNVRAAVLVAGWAQEIGLPAGNMWEPPMVRNVLTAYRETRDWRTVEVMFRDSLGLF